MTDASTHLLIVLTNAVDGTDDEFNEWYTNTHLDEVISLRGFMSAARYRNRAPGEFQYLAVYEVHAAMIDEAVAALERARESMTIPNSVRSSRIVGWYSPMEGTQVTASGTAPADGG